MNDITALSPVTPEMLASLKLSAMNLAEGEMMSFEPAVFRALVEALEKAQGMEDYWKTQCRGVVDHSEKLQAQIEQWEKLNSQFCSNADADISALRQRIASMESRTVTVKLPEDRFRYGESDYDDGFVNGWNAHGIETRRSLVAAGIQVIEGEQKNG